MKMNYNLFRWAYARNISNQTIRNFKDRSKIIFRLWMYQCEYIIAQKIRRGQQVFTLYNKLIGGNAVQRMFQAIRTQVGRRFHGFLISSVGIIGFDWDSERIKYESIKSYFNEIEFARELQRETILCNLCKKKRQINEKLHGVDYCKCMNVNNINTNSCWEPYLEREGMIIWRKQENKSLYSYKVYAKYYDITANDFLHVQTDLEYRKKWDDSAVSLDVVDSDPADKSGSHIIYWEMRWPRLFANRDYVYCRRYFVDKCRKVIVICSKSTVHPKCPIYSNKQRVDEYWSYMVIKPFDSFQEPGLEYVLTYYDNPGLAIPSTITSWVAQKQMPDFLKKLYVATKIYSQQKKNSTKKVIEKFSSWDSLKKNEPEEIKRNESDRPSSRIKKNSPDLENDSESGLMM